MKAPVIVIIGNGLAALTLAQLLSAKDISIIQLIKSKNHSTIWLENNQEAFKASMTDLFPSIDLNQVFKRCETFVSAWSTTFSDQTNPIVRYNFDKRKLIDAIQSPMHHDIRAIRYLSIATSEHAGHTWRLTLESEDHKTISIEADFIVDASGRNAIWASRYQTHHLYTDDHICLTELYEDETDQELFCIESSTRGWWYAIRHHDYIQCSFITHWIKEFQDYTAMWEHAMGQTYHIKGYRASKVIHTPLWVSDSRASILEKTCGPQWLALGDAAYCTDPLCGQGNEEVIKMVHLAAQCIQDYVGHGTFNTAAYDRALHQSMFNHQKNLSLYYGMEKRWPGQSFWNARQ